jgi:hypothetical protein
MVDTRGLNAVEGGLGARDARLGGMASQDPEVSPYAARRPRR